jgi:uncharacterized iron-regulated membrane protein
MCLVFALESNIAMPRPFQFRLATLFWATAIIAVATAVTLAIARGGIAATFAWLVGLMILPMLLISGVMMWEDLANTKARNQRHFLKWLLVFAVIFGLSLPWAVAWLILYLFPR